MEEWTEHFDVTVISMKFFACDNIHKKQLTMQTHDLYMDAMWHCPWQYNNPWILMGNNMLCDPSQYSDQTYKVSG